MRCIEIINSRPVSRALARTGTMRTKGKIASWNDAKAYGFIQPLDGGKRVFVHINAFANRDRRPEVGQVVSYGLSTDKQGRPCAARATLAGDRLPQPRKQSSSKASNFIAVTFLLIVTVVVVTTKAPLLLLAAYIVASLITFIAYAMDKSAARSGSQRTSENSLHLFALLGGWPGALIAQQKFRHKTQKQPFRNIFWLTVAVNCAGFLWLLTSDGDRFCAPC